MKISRRNSYILYDFRQDNLYHPADLFVNGRIRMANYESQIWTRGELENSIFSEIDQLLIG